jgi:ribonuclease P protein component
VTDLPRHPLAFPRRFRLKSPHLIRAILTDRSVAKRRWDAFRLIWSDKPAGGTIPSPDHPRFAFVISREVGSAPVRNRTRRRLREAVRLARDVWPDGTMHLIFRIHDDRAARLPFPRLVADVRAALQSAASGKRESR